MLARLGIRVVASLVGILIGLIVSLALLDWFSATAKALVVSTLLFWSVYLVVNFVALRILIRQPSVALAGLLALASTIGVADHRRHRRFRAGDPRREQLRDRDRDHLDRKCTRRRAGLPQDPSTARRRAPGLTTRRVCGFPAFVTPDR